MKERPITLNDKITASYTMEKGALMNLATLLKSLNAIKGLLMSVARDMKIKGKVVVTDLYVIPNDEGLVTYNIEIAFVPNQYKILDARYTLPESVINFAKTQLTEGKEV